MAEILGLKPEAPLCLWFYVIEKGLYLSLGQYNIFSECFYQIRLQNPGPSILFKMFLLICTFSIVTVWLKASFQGLVYFVFYRWDDPEV